MVFPGLVPFNVALVTAQSMSLLLTALMDGAVVFEDTVTVEVFVQPLPASVAVTV